MGGVPTVDEQEGSARRMHHLTDVLRSVQVALCEVRRRLPAAVQSSDVTPGGREGLAGALHICSLDLYRNCIWVCTQLV